MKVIVLALLFNYTTMTIDPMWCEKAQGMKWDKWKGWVMRPIC